MIPRSLGTADFFYALAMTAVFAGILLLISLLYRLVITPWQRRREVTRRVQDERLAMMARSGIFRSDFEGPKNIVLRTVEQIFNPGTLSGLQRRLFQADIYIGLPRFINIVIVCACVGFLAGWFLRSFLLQLVLGAAGGFLPFAFLRYRQDKKTRLIEQQMPDAMELLARSLRAGHTLPGAVDLASQEIPHPLGSEMRLAHEEQRLGLSMSEALEHMAARTTSKDLRYFVSAVTIQSEVGGNLAEVMENIGSLIRDRLNLKAKVMALSSHVRLSATVVTILPFALFFYFLKVNPKYMGVMLNDPKGQKLLLIGLVFIILGSIIMRRMANFKV